MRRICLLAVIVVAVTTVAGAQEYKYTTIECPGMYLIYLAGINANGVAVGAYYLPSDPDQVWHAVMVKHGVCIPLAPQSVLGTRFSMGWGVNERGDVVGDYADDVNPALHHGFLLDKHGVLTTIDFPSADTTTVESVNESGVVAGTWAVIDANGNQVYSHGFLWRNGVFTDIVFPGSLDTSLAGINARGDYVGAWDIDPNDYVRGFGFIRGEYVKVDALFPPDIATVGEAINQKGDIAGGYYSHADWIWHGYILSGSKLTFIDYPGALMTNINGINNAGQVAGWYYNPDWTVHAYMAEKAK